MTTKDSLLRKSFENLVGNKDVCLDRDFLNNLLRWSKGEDVLADRNRFIVKMREKSKWWDWATLDSKSSTAELGGKILQTVSD